MGIECYIREMQHEVAEDEGDGMEFFQQRIWEVGQKSDQIVDIHGRLWHSLEF